MSAHFSHTQSQLSVLAERVIAMALAAGASDAQVIFSEGNGLLIEVRQKRIRARTGYARSGMSLTLYCDKHQGVAHSSDFSDSGLQEAVKAAFNIARFTGVDDFSGLTAPVFPPSSLPPLDLYHPWNIDEQAAIALACDIEAGIHSVSPDVVSDGAWVRSGQSQFFLMNSLGFGQGAVQTHHNMSAKALGRRQGLSQIDFRSTEGPAVDALMEAYQVGAGAAKGAYAALDTQPLYGTHRWPVLFSPLSAMSLLDHLVQALSGALLYRNNSFLSDKAGTDLFGNHINLLEDPFIPRGLASRLFDGDGVSGQRRNIIHQGRLEGYFLSGYAARRMNMISTGNGWGPGNLIFTSEKTRAGDTLEIMLEKLNNGLFITHFSGGEPNLMNGDYSRSLRGFLVENGKIKHAVEGITVAGNLTDMFNGIVAIGDDQQTKGAFTTGSVLIDSLLVSGR